MSDSILDWRPSADAPRIKARPRPLRVMIVDDDQDIRKTLSVLVEIEGMVVVGLVEDGMDAVDVAMEEQPDVVVLDYMMPNLDGEETAKFLRAVSPRSRIIAFSGAAIAPPRWADAFMAKGESHRIIQLIQSLNIER
jgi:CheY-like chemotaxis protein